VGPEGKPPEYRGDADAALGHLGLEQKPLSLQRALMGRVAHSPSQSVPPVVQRRCYLQLPCSRHEVVIEDGDGNYVLEVYVLPQGVNPVTSPDVHTRQIHQVQGDLVSDAQFPVKLPSPVSLVVPAAISQGLDVVKVWLRDSSHGVIIQGVLKGARHLNGDFRPT
jgi:hypothetical protein